MKTESHSINDVLAKNSTSFFIPPFQRSYAWGKPEIERYFDDVVRIVDSELNDADIDKLEHFFGTIVIKEEQDGFASRSVVVDGQQRLTTTLIFLIALRDLETDPDNRDHITHSYLKNRSSTFEDKIKLKQVTHDWEAYRALINQTQPHPGTIYNAYKLFKNFLQTRRQTHPEIALEHYLVALRRMNVAVIFLDERPFKGEDPQIIFETLNSLGRPLTLSDLVRNFILLGMSSDEQTKIYEGKWYPQIEQILTDERTSKFFRDYLQYKTVQWVKVVSDNNTKEVYHQFKEYVLHAFETREAFVDDILPYVRWYDWITSKTIQDAISSDRARDTQIKELLHNIFHDIVSEAFKPFVLGLLEYHQQGKEDVFLSDDQLIEVLEVIRTYLIRRRVLRLTQGENKNIVLLSDQIADLATGSQTIHGLLANQPYHLRLPNDLEVKRQLEEIEFAKSLKSYTKFILGKIEEYESGRIIPFRENTYHMQYVMPEKLTSSWKQSLGVNSEELHKTYVHNIGNLVLTESDHGVSTHSFEGLKSRLTTTKMVHAQNILKANEWRETEIKEHQQRMISAFLDTFSVPSSYKTSSNWNTATVSTNLFSPLEIDAGEIAAGNKPGELLIKDKPFKVRDWRDMYLTVLRYLRDHERHFFDFLMLNQDKILGKRDAILRWQALEPLMGATTERGRYKTLDNEFYDQVVPLNPHRIFVYVTHSAPQFMENLANIMEQFSMEKDDILIELR